MKVLFLSSCVNGGGAGQSLKAYLDHMDDRIEAHVVMPEPGIMAEAMKNVAGFWFIPEFVERVQRSPYAFCDKIKWLAPTLHLISGFIAVGISMFKITKLARELGAEVIYCNHMLANPVGAFVGWRTGIPVVFHARNIHVNWFGRKFYRFLASRECVKKVVCNSLASSLIYREYMEEKVEVVYNFVDLKKFDRAQVEVKLRQEYGIASDALVVGYVGRILPKKGIPVLLEAFQSVARDFPKAVLAIVGDNDGGVHSDLRSQYKTLADELGIGDRTYFVGFREDIRPYVSDFDLLVLPSVEPESFGRVLIEAMAFGIPSVVSAHGGAVEVVRHGLNGLWSKPGDSEDLARAISRLLANPELRHEMGRHGELDVKAEFSAEQQAKRLTKILMDLTPQILPYRLPERRRLRAWGRTLGVKRASRP